MVDRACNNRGSNYGDTYNRRACDIIRGACYNKGGACGEKIEACNSKGRTYDGWGAYDGRRACNNRRRTCGTVGACGGKDPHWQG